MFDKKKEKKKVDSSYSGSYTPTPPDDSFMMNMLMASSVQDHSSVVDTSSSLDCGNFDSGGGCDCGGSCGCD